MKMPPIVTPLEWKAAREQLLVKEKELTRARDAPASLLDVFEGRRQLIVIRAFYEPVSTPIRRRPVARHQRLLSRR